MLIKLRTMMRKDEKGFTLVELIVVMAILAILVSLAIPRFSNVMIDSKFKAHNANVELLTRAIEMYNAQEDEEWNAEDLTALATKKYVKKKPELPIKGLLAGDRVKEKITETGYTYDTANKKIKPGAYELKDDEGKDKWTVVP